MKTLHVTISDLQDDGKVNGSNKEAVRASEEKLKKVITTLFTLKKEVKLIFFFFNFFTSFFHT